MNSDNSTNEEQVKGQLKQTELIGFIKLGVNQQALTSAYASTMENGKRSSIRMVR